MNKKILDSSLERSFAIKTLERSIDEEKRTVEVAFSSEAEVERWFGIEVLDHAADSIQLGRLLNGGAVLMDHDRKDHVGVVESVRVDADRVARATLRFGRSARSMEVFNDVIDGIRRHISVGYSIRKYEVTEGENGSPDLVRVVDWEPFEISLVSVPADASVGVGRSKEILNTQNEEGSQMGDKVKTEAAREESKVEAQAERTIEVQKSVPQINVEEVRAQERSRVAEISAAADAAPWDLSALKREAIEKGLTIDQFRAKAFEFAKDAPSLGAAQGNIDEMKKESGRDYSVTRALMAKLDGDWSQAGFEREVSQELARSGGFTGGGVLVPMDVLSQTRASDTTTASGLVPTAHMAGMFIDTLRARTLAGRIGARFMNGLDGNVTIPKKTANASFGWIGEGSNASESDVTVGNVTLSAKHVGGAVPMTFELLRQSSPAAEAMVREDLISGIALAIDKAAFQGTGASNQPLGLLNTAGIGTVTLADVSGKVPTWAEIVEMEGLIDDENALIENLSYLFRAPIAAALKSQSKDSGSGRFVIDGSECNGYRYHKSSQLPVNASVFGNFADLIIGTWGVVELIPDRDALSGGLKIGCHQLADVAVRNAESFVKGV